MKAKFKVTQLAAKPVDFELIHPVEGNTGIIVKIAGPHSTQFRDAVTNLQSMENPVQRGLEILAACVVGWDEEAFEQPFTPEAAAEYFKNPENQWAAEQLGGKIHDESLFFRKVG